MDRFKIVGICVLASTLALSGCVTRTYNLTRDRVDQDLSSSAGNRGYLIGQAPEPQERPSTRTTRVFEVELGFAKSKANCPSTTPLATGIEEPAMSQETTAMNFEKYTVAKNDTLQKISKKFYGTTKRWMKIYEANKDTLRAPDKLYPGQTLNIPVEPNLNAGSEENLK